MSDRYRITKFDMDTNGVKFYWQVWDRMFPNKGNRILIACTAHEKWAKEIVQALEQMDDFIPNNPDCRYIDAEPQHISVVSERLFKKFKFGVTMKYNNFKMVIATFRDMHSRDMFRTYLNLKDRMAEGYYSPVNPQDHEEMQRGSRTGRYSSKSPGLQNLPRNPFHHRNY
jgi:hypothetical protein